MRRPDLTSADTQSEYTWLSLCVRFLPRPLPKECFHIKSHCFSSSPEKLTKVMVASMEEWNWERKGIWERGPGSKPHTAPPPPLPPPSVHNQN